MRMRFVALGFGAARGSMFASSLAELLAHTKRRDLVPAPLSSAPCDPWANQSCGLLCRVVELDRHGPRHTVAYVNSHAHYTCVGVVLGHHFTQKFEEPRSVKRFVIQITDPFLWVYGGHRLPPPRQPPPRRHPLPPATPAPS